MSLNGTSSWKYNPENIIRATQEDDIKNNTDVGYISLGAVSLVSKVEKVQSRTDHVSKHLHLV